jgi:cyclopropane-fatty-acyl-phospholipid synthase
MSDQRLTYSATRKEQTMVRLATKTTDQALQVTLSLLQDVLGSAPASNVAVRLWDGTTWKPDPAGPTRCTLVLQHPGALRKMFLPPNELSLGEAYLYNDFDIEGEIEAIVPLIKHFITERKGKLEQVRYGTRLLGLPKMGQPRPSDAGAKMHGLLHSKERDHRAINYHYDRLPNDFFAPWLDSRMIYTCAYFSTPDDDLETAQERKLDYICHKLRLRPGERLLDIGCGWGGLVIYAAQHYGVQVDGVVLSTQQGELGRERIRQLGLEQSCHIDICDYREVNKPEGYYDKIVAVGIAEHLGKVSLPGYYKSVWGLLRPGGVFLNHSIGIHSTARLILGRDFVHRYIFPDAEPTIPISTMLQAAESAGFQVRDVENLKEHYVYTLRHWLRSYEEHADEVKKVTDELTYRSYRVFLAVALHEYEVQTAHLYQTLLVKSDKGITGLPLTRDDWYAPVSLS